MLPSLCSPSQTFVLSSFSNLLSENNLANLFTLHYSCLIRQSLLSVKGTCIIQSRSKNSLAVRFLDHGAGKGRTCFGQESFFSDSEIILRVRLPSKNACSE